VSNLSLSIAFLLGWPDISGGTYVIYEHSTHLRKLGHRVTLITENEINQDRYLWHPTAAELDWLTLEQASIEKFDIVIATWWESPFLLHLLSASHYVYFVQSIESRFFEEDPTHHDKRDLSILREFCESSYSFNIPVITEAKWIQQYLYKKYNTGASLVRNGIRKDIYQEKGKAITARQKGKLRVLVEGPVDVFYKNVPKSIELCRQAGADEIWLLTSSAIETFPGVDRVFSCVPIHDTPAIYRSCDVLVKLSYVEGMFGPPLEMFHCGGAAIVYDVTGHDEYIVHGENSYVVEKDDDEQVINYLTQLKENPDVLQRLKKRAVITAEKWPDWKVSSAEFGHTLLEIFKQPGTSRNYLENWTKKLKNDSITRFTARTAQQFTARELVKKGDTHEADNFVQLYYWNEKDGLQPENTSWFHYIGGKQIKARFEITVSGFPFWIRIDPSVRIGVLNIEYIEMVNARTGENILSCSTPEEFSQLCVTGTLYWFKGGSTNTFLSYGDDPQIILPAAINCEVGDSLLVSVSLLESGIAQFVEENCVTASRVYPRICGRLRDVLRPLLGRSGT